MSPPRSSWRARACLFALLVVASWPYLAVLELWPMAADTGPWIQRGDPASDGWLEWVFQTQHFRVGYRPVTGLSFTLNALIDPHAPLVLRGTDIGLHLALAWLVAILARQLAPELGARAGLCAAALYLLHPALEEVVPFSARRSYTLAGVFTVGALALACRVARSEAGLVRRLAWSLPVGLLLAAGLLSNEVAGVAIGALPLLVFATQRRARVLGTLAACVVPALLVGAALFARAQVVDGLGGYATDEDAPARHGAILLSAWRDTLGSGFASGWLASGALFAVALASLAAAHVLSVFGAAGAARRERALCTLALVVWLAAYGLLFADQGVWFARQAFPIAVPFALLGGLHLAQALQAERVARAPLALLALGLAPLVLTSPVLHGLDAERSREWAQRHALIDGLLAAADEVEEGARIKTVLPFSRPTDTELRGQVAQKKLPREARQPIVWVQYVLGERATDVFEFLYVEEPTADWTSPTALETQAGKPAVRLPEGREVLLCRGRSVRQRNPSAGPLQPLQLDVMELRRIIYVYLYDAQGGTWTQVHTP